MQPTARQAVAAMVCGVVAMILVAGCESNHKHASGVPAVTLTPQTVDTLLTEASQQMPVESAVIRQHTLYPYHFVQNGAALNELGQRDVDILAAHYREYPGPLGVRKDDIPDSLYQARLATVRSALQAAGVDVQQVEMGDFAPGGEGESSERTVIVLRQPLKSGQSRTVSVGSVMFPTNEHQDNAR